MPRPLLIDSHVHIIGDGSAGSGCWLRLKHSYHKFLAQIILKSLGLPSCALNNGLDHIYSEQLARLVRESSLDAAIILAHEKVYDEAGKPIDQFGSFYTPNDYVLALAKKYSDCFIPAVSIHPARVDAMDELERCIESGAAMIKLLPNCQNLDCSDKRFTKFWERLASANMPFLAHTGGELSVPVINAAYADPALLKLPLECGVTVIAAHCGSRSLFCDPNYISTFLQMIERYPNFYGDNSGMNTPFRSAYFKDILSERAQSKIIHGSDFPIPISANWTLLRSMISFSTWRESRLTKNPLERDIIIKRGLGFKDETFSKIKDLLPTKALLGINPTANTCR